MSIHAASGSSTTALHSRLSRFFAIVFSLCEERGPRRETLQSPNRDRCCCQQPSSLTCPLPRTHAFRRASQAPLRTSGRSLPHSHAPLSSLISSSFRPCLGGAQSIAYRNVAFQS